MLIGEIIIVALSAIRANKLRSLLTMLGIVIGVAAVITMVALGSGAQKAVQDQIESLGTNLLTVYPGQSFMRGVASGDRVSLTVDDAKALEQAGAFSVLLEMVPDRVCGLITQRAQNCFIISLGSGPDANGQLLIYHDMFGLYPRFKPRMAKVFAEAGTVILNGLRQYVAEVTTRKFPAEENWFGMPDDAYAELLKLIE